MEIEGSINFPSLQILDRPLSNSRLLYQNRRLLRIILKALWAMFISGGPSFVMSRTDVQNVVEIIFNFMNYWGGGGSCPPSTSSIALQ